MEKVQSLRDPPPTTEATPDLVREVFMWTEVEKHGPVRCVPDLPSVFGALLPLVGCRPYLPPSSALGAQAARLAWTVKNLPDGRMTFFPPTIASMHTFLQTHAAFIIRSVGTS